MSPVGLIAILAGVWTRHDIVQSLVRRADELIFFGIIRKMVGTILVFEGFIYLSKHTGIMVEGVVFEIVLYMVLLQIGIILFAAIGGIRYNLVRQTSQPLL